MTIDIIKWSWSSWNFRLGEAENRRFPLKASSIRGGICMDTKMAYPPRPIIALLYATYRVYENICTI
jgi:hypothetical protein